MTSYTPISDGTRGQEIKIYNVNKTTFSIENKINNLQIIIIIDTRFITNY